jgi:hypothetical protein
MLECSAFTASTSFRCGVTVTHFVRTKDDKNRKVMKNNTVVRWIPTFLSPYRIERRTHRPIFTYVLHWHNQYRSTSNYGLHFYAKECSDQVSANI